jgi:spermidine/putrescine transport system substrate-binding protein
MHRHVLTAAILALTPIGQAAHAAGELHIYNWGNYTNPDLIKKFEQAYDVKVTITDYDSNDTALAKVKAGGHGFDIAVPSGNFMPLWINDGLLLESRPDQMANFQNVDPKWVDVPYDPGRHYSVPWQWGVTGITVDTAAYDGDIDTWGIIFDPPPELKGKINVVPEMNDVVAAAVMYVGGEPCTGDKAILKKARDVLVAAKPNWLSMEYTTVDTMSKGDFKAGSDWNGAALRIRLKLPSVHFGFPKEGFPIFMDNAAILKDAQNVENAKLFLNFIMDPENAAMLSAFARYANGIKGSEKFLPADMIDAPELTLPEGNKGRFVLACPPEVNELVTRIWTEIQK